MLKSDHPEPAQEAMRLRRVIVRATRPVAYESPDHLVPWGTRRDNSVNPRFNQKLYRLLGEQRGPSWILDLGCSGGGFVKECLDEGGIAVGLEGSDFSQKMKRAEWRTIPEFLFTADITAPFEVLGEFSDGEKRLLFDTVTAWEVMEHIHDRDLPGLAQNVKNHLRPGGLWIMSVANEDDIVKGINLHQTVKPKSWWIERMAGLGLHHREEYVRYFNTQFVRGPKYMARSSFHLVLTNNPDLAPPIPSESLGVKLYDTWLGSAPQRLLRYAICGV